MEVSVIVDTPINGFEPYGDGEYIKEFETLTIDIALYQICNICSITIDDIKNIDRDKDYFCGDFEKDGNCYTINID